ncbi:cytochrome p450 [Diplodia corticola]|uniref:Cytochrome p450 n=1 Tax=Diplodia corticola TaxID=236234 RepID=A0A1J9QWW1_9PEZI|nr:cytochrome p450 [Diplodia corticola]OJD32474.1 cytochrome p450 [Diplodia corticola]
MSSWKMVRHGEWRRPLGVRERMVLRQLDTTRPGHFPGTITAALRLEHAFDDDDFARRCEAAWKALRRAHPSIAATIEGGDAVYRTGAHEWVQGTFRIQYGTGDAAALYATARLGGGDKCCLHVLPGSGEVVLSGPHWILDGVGALLLLNDLCRFIATPPMEPELGDEEVSALSPALEEAAAIPPASPAVWQRAKELVAGWSAKRNEAVCIPSTPSAGQPGPFGRRRALLSAAATAAVRRAAKSKGLSVTHLTHAALIVAAARHDERHSREEGERPTRHWCGGLPINARPWCSPSHAAGAYFVGVPCVVDNIWELMEAAQELKARYREWQDGSHVLQLLEPLEQMTKPPKAAAEMDGPALPLYSGIGEVERFISVHGQSMQIRDFWFAMRNISPRVVDVYCYTACGRLALDASFNPTYHSDESMERLLGGMTELLTEAARNE